MLLFFQEPRTREGTPCFGTGANQASALLVQLCARRWSGRWPIQSLRQNQPTHKEYSFSPCLSAVLGVETQMVGRDAGGRGGKPVLCCCYLSATGGGLAVLSPSSTASVCHEDSVSRVVSLQAHQNVSCELLTASNRALSTQVLCLMARSGQCSVNTRPCIY